MAWMIGRLRGNAHPVGLHRDEPPLVGSLAVDPHGGDEELERRLVGAHPSRPFHSLPVRSKIVFGRVGRHAAVEYATTEHGPKPRPTRRRRAATLQPAPAKTRARRQEPGLLDGAEGSVLREEDVRRGSDDPPGGSGSRGRSCRRSVPRHGCRRSSSLQEGLDEGLGRDRNRRSVSVGVGRRSPCSREAFAGWLRIDRGTRMARMADQRMARRARMGHSCQAAY